MNDKTEEKDFYNIGDFIDALIESAKDKEAEKKKEIEDIER